MSKLTKITEVTEVFIPEYLELIQIHDDHNREHWLPDEADMREDTEQWKNGIITDSEKEFIKMVLRLFTQSDTNVASGYYDKLIPMFKHANARLMLGDFAAREGIHVLAYKRLNDTLGYDSVEFLTDFLNYKEMADKHEFMIGASDMHSIHGKAEYLAKQILMEGVNLFASFAMLLNYSRSGLLPGMVSVNKWSIIDESLHIKGLTELFRIFVGEHPKVLTDMFKKKVYEIARVVVDLEDKFIDLCFEIGTTRKLEKQELKDYIRYVCDYRMTQMGFKPQFGIETDPLPWVIEETGNTFVNFFERTNVQYSKNNLSGEWLYPEF